MGAGTGSGSDSNFNECGIAYGHAYSIITTFSMTDANSNVYDMIMLRNPWGITYYDGTWHKDDAAWTSSLISQVPFGINPTTSDSDGVFFMSKEDFVRVPDDYDCINSYEVNYYLAPEGYKNNYYDIMEDDGTQKSYFFEMPKSEGTLFFSAETYYQEMVPSECVNGGYTP